MHDEQIVSAVQQQNFKYEEKNKIRTAQYRKRCQMMRAYYAALGILIQLVGK